MSPGALYLRRRQPGDRFRPLGLGGHRTRVSQLLINLKVPRPWRDAIPLLVAGDTILWVCGFRLDEAVRVTEHTQEVLHLRFNKVDDGR
jgi:tRNA(Ile)-lysidine synthase